MKVDEQRRKSSLLLDRAFAFKENCVRFGNNESFEHALAKFILCYELYGEGKQFVTEARFSNKSRADIFVLDDCEAWEVLASETDEMFKKKVQRYPCAVFPYRVKDVLKEVGVNEGVFDL